MTLYERYKFLRGSIIIIEGNISSGKSTLCKNIANFLNSIGLDTKLFEEPILDSYLDMYIKNMKKYAFGFQISMLLERQKLFQQAEQFIEHGGIAVMDRSTYGDKVFALLHHEQGNIDINEWNVYQDIFSRTIINRTNYFIYLNVNPDVNVRRCIQRNRGCEKDFYTLEYFQNLNNLYQKILTDVSLINNVINIDWNQDIDPSDFTNHVHNILNKLHTSYFQL